MRLVGPRLGDRGYYTERTGQLGRSRSDAEVEMVAREEAQIRPCSARPVRACSTTKPSQIEKVDPMPAALRAPTATAHALLGYGVSPNPNPDPDPVPALAQTIPEP